MLHQPQTTRAQPQRTQTPDRVAPTPVREPTIEEIRTRAYQLYEKRNRAPGDETEDWLQAERELRLRYPK